MNEEPLKQIEKDLDRALDIMVSNYSLILQIDNSLLKKEVDGLTEDELRWLTHRSKFYSVSAVLCEVLKLRRSLVSEASNFSH